jgi:hypothetical protein
MIKLIKIYSIMETLELCNYIQKVQAKLINLILISKLNFLSNVPSNKIYNAIQIKKFLHTQL